MEHSEISDIIDKIQKEIPKRSGRSRVYLLTEKTIQEVELLNGGKIIRRRNPEDIKERINYFAEKRHDTLGFVPITPEAYKILIETGPFWPILMVSRNGTKLALYNKSQ